MASNVITVTDNIQTNKNNGLSVNVSDTEQHNSTFDSNDRPEDTNSLYPGNLPIVSALCNDAESKLAVVATEPSSTIQTSFNMPNLQELIVASNHQQSDESDAIRPAFSLLQAEM